ncbi:MAG: 2Fe-2S iron-sulfur cluster binding domain-containing protein [Alphaproteobacteria bacterium]|nr:2Fe-2S iron-sulfur cluster binding domain-containing protein [Alphaproteobacteria bacterium]
MVATVRIRQWPKPIGLEPGQVVLEAALDAGVPYPFGCQSGNCGACKSMLIEGEVTLAEYSEFALTDEERAQGLVLACRSMADHDIEIAWIEGEDLALHARRTLDCTVKALDRLTHDITGVTLSIEGGGPFTFTAGQFARVTFPGQKPRDYSMASRPEEADLIFHIRHMAGGSVSAFVAGELKVGMPVKVEGPHGIAHLKESHTGPILALAGGSGLAPIKSIVETALAKGRRGPVHLYFGARDERDVYLEDHFKALAAKHPNLIVHVVLSAPSDTTSRRTGFLHEAVLADFPSLDGAKAYVAGPPLMVDAVTPVLTQKKMRREDIHADAFYTEAEKPKAGT